MRAINLFALVVSLMLLGCKTSDRQKRLLQYNEKTIFQTAASWKPTIDVRADVTIIYGADDRLARDGRPLISFEERVQSWRDRGYITHFMTGISWGNYQDYFTGKWDGNHHLDEAQMSMNGDTIWHGPMVPYVVPSLTFLEYMKEMHVKRVIDAGINAIYMEEPEFWMRAGYSDAFKREWEAYYGFSWHPQHESPGNTYLSNKLKYHLYYRALDEVFTFAKEYGKSKGIHVKCYVPTHSLPSYSSIEIISPEAALASLSCVDGYIAQVWTGTARVPTFFNGLSKERVFENAFIEYGSMESMTRPTGRKMFFLTDPIEDQPRDWVDYKKNYQATFCAQLFYPMIADYEVMPWPDRIYEGLYKTCDTCSTKERIPRFYSTQMQVMINTLNDMPLSDNKVSGSHGIGVMMSNSLMFQRFPTHDGYDDPQFSNFYGQVLPLLKRGIPVSIVHMENVSYPDTWKDLKVLVVSYSNMKPMSPDCHQYIAEWVKNGGALVYCGKDVDPYQTVMEWWNSNRHNYNRPSQHLFERMGLPFNTPESGVYTCGKGKVYVIREEPKEFVLRPNHDVKYFETIREAFETAPNDGKLETKNSFFIERGPYTIAAVMDESVSNEPLTLEGTFIDLFDSTLPVLDKKIISPGEQAFLYNVEKINDRKKAVVLCGASRIYDEVFTKNSYSFVAKSPIDTDNVSRVLVPRKPLKVVVKNPKGDVLTNAGYSWDDISGTCLVKFENDPDGIKVEISW